VAGGERGGTGDQPGPRAALGHGSGPAPAGNGAGLAGDGCHRRVDRAEASTEDADGAEDGGKALDGGRQASFDRR
jgi:hypothetical protein